MEEKRNGGAEEHANTFIETLEKAQNGDKEAMQEILDVMDPEIKQLSKYVRLPREDAIQTLKTELINIVKRVLKI